MTGWRVYQPSFNSGQCTRAQQRTALGSRSFVSCSHPHRTSMHTSANVQRKTYESACEHITLVFTTYLHAYDLLSVARFRPAALSISSPSRTQPFFKSKPYRSYINISENSALSDVNTMTPKTPVGDPNLSMTLSLLAPPSQAVCQLDFTVVTDHILHAVTRTRTLPQNRTNDHADCSINCYHKTMLCGRISQQFPGPMSTPDMLLNGLWRC